MFSPRLAFAAFAVVAFAASPSLAQEVDVELVADIHQNPQPRGSGSDRWVEAGGRLYFQRFEEGRLELWRTDGTAEGTELVRELAARLDVRTVSTDFLGGALPDGRLLFSAYDPYSGNELWISGGPGAETRPWADLCPGSCESRPGAAGGGAGFVRFGDEVLFSAFVTPTEEARLFAAAGDGADPRRVSEIPVERWLALDDRIFILERAPFFADPWKLWVRDGEPGLERLVQELDLQDAGALLPLGAGVLLAARDDAGDVGIYFGAEDEGEALQRLATLGSESPGTTRAVAGTSLAYVAFGFFDQPCRLYRTDGTPAGTFELGAVAATGAEYTACPEAVEVVGDRLFFDLETPEHGREL